MIDFMKWKIQESGWTKINNSAIKPFVTYHVAHNPPHLNIRVLPDRYKDRITQQFDNFIQWCEDENLDKKYIIAAQGIKNGVCSYMNNESYYNTHWKEFIEYSFSLDKIRGEKLIDTVPALGEYVNG